VSNLSALGMIPGSVNGPLTMQRTPISQQTALSAENNKIEKSAKDFESILLGSWLQQAEQSFGSLPGGDAEGDDDSGKEQFQGIAMQSLGASMTASGGIGIAKMISKQLHKADDAQAASETKMETGSTKK
jgi:Rod binding domain-containing protein